MEKFTRVIAKEDIKTFDDAGIAQLGNLNKIVDEVNNKPIYKVYTASLTQIGTNNIQAQVFENTIDSNAYWTRLNPGDYLLKFPSLIYLDQPSLFNGAKFWSPMGNQWFGAAVQSVPVFSFNSYTPAYYYSIFPKRYGIINPPTFTNWDANGITLFTWDTSGTTVELSTLLEDPENSINIEFRLYP